MPPKVPGQLGIGVCSPALDERGNSVRGVRACESISRDLGLHFLQPPRAAVSTVRARYTLAGVRSKRRRPPSQNHILDDEGHRVRVFELQGDLRFATLEPVLREVVAAGDALQYVVLDFRRVSNADRTATRMLASLVDSCAERGQQVVLTRVRRGELLAGFSGELHPKSARTVSFQPQLDAGLEWCERGLLERHGAPRIASAIAVLAQHRLCEGASEGDISLLESLVERRSYEPGSLIVRTGEPADAIYFLMAGEVSVIVEVSPGSARRLSTLSAGMGCGEAALIAGGLRLADVRADTPVECCLLAAETFTRLALARRSLMVRLLHNLLQSATRTTRRLTREVAALEG